MATSSASSKGSSRSSSVRVSQVDPSLPLQPYQESTLSLALSSGSSATPTQGTESWGRRGGSDRYGSQRGRGGGDSGSSGGDSGSSGGASGSGGDQESSIDDFFGDHHSSAASSFNLHDDDRDDVSRSDTETDTEVREMELKGNLKKAAGAKTIAKAARGRVQPRFHVEIDRGDAEKSSSTLSSGGASFGGSSRTSSGSDKSTGTRSRQSSIRSQSQRRKRAHELHDAPVPSSQGEEEAEPQAQPVSMSQHVVALTQRISRLKQLLKLFGADSDFHTDFDAEDEACVAADIQKAEEELRAVLRQVPSQDVMKFKLECTIRRRELLLEQAVLSGKLDPEKDDGVFGYFVKKQVKLMELLG